MQHRNLKYFVLLCISMLTACNSQDAGNEQERRMDSTETVESTPIHDLQQDNPAFSNWVNHYHINVPDSFTESGAQSDIYVYPGEINLSDYELYKPLLVYNSDSSRFIDAYSYWLILDHNKTGNLTARTGDPDVEVAVVDVKNKKKKRVFFCGSSCMVQKAFWYSSDVVAIAGMVSENANGQFTPVIWFINTVNGSATQYNYSKTISSEEASAYFKEEMVSKGVVVE